MSGSTYRRIGLVVIALVAAILLATPAGALPTIDQPGRSRDPLGPASQPATMNDVASRNFGDGTPGEAITGGVFNDYGIPGFFPPGDPGSGTGGWVSGIALGPR